MSTFPSAGRGGARGGGPASLRRRDRGSEKAVRQSSRHESYYDPLLSAGWIGKDGNRVAGRLLILTIGRRRNEIGGEIASAGEADLERRSGGNVGAAQDVEAPIGLRAHVLPSLRLQLAVGRGDQDQRLGKWKERQF